MANQKYTYPRRHQTHFDMVINLIACIDANGAIGHQNQLLFPIKEDLENFKKLTTGHTILMGRKTFDSLPHGALPNRRNIVVSKHNISFKGCDTYHSIEEAMSSCQNETLFVIGGESIYQQTIRIADALYLTIVDAKSEKADAYFPSINRKEWEVEENGQPKKARINERKEITYHFEVLKRKRKGGGGTNQQN